MTQWRGVTIYILGYFERHIATGQDLWLGQTGKVAWRSEASALASPWVSGCLGGRSWGTV